MPEIDPLKTMKIGGLSDLAALKSSKISEWKGRRVQSLGDTTISEELITIRAGSKKSGTTDATSEKTRGVSLPELQRKSILPSRSLLSFKANPNRRPSREMTARLSSVGDVSVALKIDDPPVKSPTRPEGMRVSPTGESRMIRASGVRKKSDSVGSVKVEDSRAASPTSPLTLPKDIIGTIKRELCPNGVQPSHGATPGSRLYSNMFSKVGNVRMEDLFTRYVGRFFRVPQTKILTSEEVKIFKDCSSDYRKLLQENDDVMVAARVEGVDFTSLMKDDLLRKSFNSRIEKRMQEFGLTALVDLLIGNQDRCVRLNPYLDDQDLSFRDSTELPLQSGNTANTGNFMYTVDADGNIKQYVGIDNCSSDVLVDDSAATHHLYVRSFMKCVGRLDELADHVLCSISYSIAVDRYHDNIDASIDILELGTNPEKLKKLAVERFNEGRDPNKQVTYDVLKKNVIKGLKLGIEMVKTIGGDRAYFDTLTKDPERSEEEILLLEMIYSRIEALREESTI